MANHTRLDLDNEDNWTQIMLIGDPKVGKLSLPRRYIHNQPPLPPEWEIWSQENSIEISLPLDSSPILPNGQPNRQGSRTISRTNAKSREEEPGMMEMGIYFYKSLELEIEPPIPAFTIRRFNNVHVAAICYDCSRPETLQSAIYKWYPLVLHYCSGVPIFLLGCKSDMKTWDPKLAPRPFVTTEEAKRAAQQIGAIDALECSAWESDTVKKVGDLLAWYGHYHHFPDNGPSSTLWSRLQALLRRRGRKKPRSG